MASEVSGRAEMIQIQSLGQVLTETKIFQRLDERIAGRPIEQMMVSGVPVWAARTLREWVRVVLDSKYSYNLAQRVALRLQLEAGVGTSYRARVADEVQDSDLLLVADAILQLHFSWDSSTPQALTALEDQLNHLDEILLDMGSTYRLDRGARRLLQRVDPTAEVAARSVVDNAPAAASDHIRAAWLAAYGLEPDPDKAFNEAIRAVEEVACPLVENKKAAKNLATLGTVLGELGKNAPDRWELVLPGTDGQPRGIEAFVGMLEILWHAQVSRHGGGQMSRRQNQSEAEAAVQLAVLLVQWLITGVLRRKH